MLDFFMKFLPSYEGMTLVMFATYLLAGVFGALVRVAWLDKPIRGFYRIEGEQGVKMGFYAEVVTAMAVAVIVAGHPIRAGIASIFAPWILDAARTVVVDRLPAMLKALLTTAIGGPPSDPK